MVDAIEAFGNVGIQHPCGFLVDLDIDGIDRVPSIHRFLVNRVHSFLTPSCPVTFQTTGLTPAYPLAFPEALAS